MNRNRKGESCPLPYRTGRFFIGNSNWYFTTREKLDHGPFPTREKAERECKTYIRICLSVEQRLGQGGNFTPAPQRKLV